ncbi:MAG: NAD-dependent epimerase/dehydratase family protein [Bacteroidaceae bacterium]|nr:NAD-dependent epimerase/dehydratase family protein [Bacteroidaceae bacterium]
MNKENALYQQDLRNIVSMPGIETLHGKTILITGATGMVGTHLIDALMLLGDVKVYAVGRDKNRAMDRLGSYYDSPLFTFVEQDVCNKFPSDIKPDIIIPLASNTHPLAYSQYPVETMLINIKGAEHALNLAVETGATVLYPSTVEVYGNAIGEDTFSEDYTGKLNLSTPRSCYTESKRSAEAMCQSFIAEKGAKVKIVRLSRLFGPTMLMTDSKASSQFIKKALAHKDIILKSEGNQLFSYTYITDAVRAMLHVLIYGEVGTAYNISCESCDVRLKEFAGLCAQYNGKDVIFELPSETEQKGFSVAQKAVLDNSRLRSIGWTPLYNMKDALWRTLDIIAS